MLKELTLNEDTLKKKYEFYKDLGNKLSPSFEDYLEEFKPIEPGIYDALDWTIPKYNLMSWFSEFTRPITGEDMKILSKGQIGMADNIGQIKDYYKEELEDSDKSYVIFLQYIEYRPDKKGGGFMPGLNGIYLGEYKEQLDREEFYNNCIFPENYQNYIIAYHFVPVL